MIFHHHLQCCVLQRRRLRCAGLTLACYSDGWNYRPCAAGGAPGFALRDMGALAGDGRATVLRLACGRVTDAHHLVRVSLVKP